MSDPQTGSENVTGLHCRKAARPGIEKGYFVMLNARERKHEKQRSTKSGTITQLVINRLVVVMVAKVIRKNRQSVLFLLLPLSLGVLIVALVLLLVLTLGLTLGLGLGQNLLLVTFSVMLVIDPGICLIQAVLVLRPVIDDPFRLLLPPTPIFIQGENVHTSTKAIDKRLLGRKATIEDHRVRGQDQSPLRGG